MSLSPIARNARAMLARAVLPALAAAFMAAPAQAANVTACTNSDQIVNVAMAYPTDLEVFSIVGWWTIPAGGCTTLTPTPRNETHYFFAFTQNRDFTWPTATGRKLCLSGDQFDFSEIRDISDCPVDAEERFFWPMQPVGGGIKIDFNQ